MNIDNLTSNIPTLAGEIKPWGSLAGASLSLAISQIAAQVKTPILLVTADSAAANQLFHELDFLLADNTALPVLLFPDWETLPYDNFSPHRDIISERLAGLYKIHQINKGIVIVAINTLIQRIIPADFLLANSFVLNTKDNFDLSSFRERLEKTGYHHVNQVMEHGEYAIRGSILDLYPMGSKNPFRIDLLGDEVDSIRFFDPETQRSGDKLEHIRLLPAREFPLDEAAISRFRQNWRSRFEADPLNSSIYQNVSKGLSSPGIEYYIPLFFEHTSLLFDYLPKALYLQVGDIVQAQKNYWQEINSRYEQLRYDITRPLIVPSDLFATIEELQTSIQNYPQIIFNKETPTNTSLLPDLLADNKSNQPLEKLQQFINSVNSPVLFSSETAGRRESLLEFLKSNNIFPTVYHSWSEFLTNQSNKPGIIVAPFTQGFQASTLTIITEAELYGQQVLQRRLRKRNTFDANNLIRNLTELNVGAAVVHIEHGIGRYLGLQTIQTGEQTAEFLQLEFAGGDKLYVPVSALDLISRYTGVDAEHVQLNRLGSKQWDTAKRKAAEKIRDVAAELLDVYARRAAEIGFAFKAPDQHYQAFAASFPFETTPDQQNAINDVINDMTSARTMDRLVCGDVGFGKTEVAMRAAFLAVQSNKQVVILVPTTILATQHYQTFKDRFADWPFKIGILSRFQNTKEQQKTITELGEGKIDIVIGTHKLLNSSIKFKDLGLLLVDEEHRFGVGQKEKIKTLRAHVDILTLTATPIPRTLNMSLAHVRDLSIIASPPARRLAIKTFVHNYNKNLIKEAIMRETLRGGQVYFLHNNVQTMAAQERELQSLLPEARIGVAHGQMAEGQLERVMADFYHHKYNILLCTTIVESGIDVPTANTMIINRADMLGLAQLYQLRGRVGRSHHQAYTYLLTPDPKAMTPDAGRRLEALAALDELGAGFTLATHDLEIRGAGELLGEEQSGHIQAIGFSLYMELLEEAVAAIKSGKVPDLDKPLKQGTEINIRMSALLPDDYVHDVHSRLTLYKRIANAKSIADLDELQIEMIDRFGLLPEPAKNLFKLTELKQQAADRGIAKIDVGPQYAYMHFSTNPKIKVDKLIKLVQTQAHTYKLEGQEKLRIKLAENLASKQLEAIKILLTEL